MLSIDPLGEEQLLRHDDGRFSAAGRPRSSHANGLTQRFFAHPNELPASGFVAFFALLHFAPARCLGVSYLPSNADDIAEPMARVVRARRPDRPRAR
jgi:hypothetical protein